MAAGKAGKRVALLADSMVVPRDDWWAEMTVAMLVGHWARMRAVRWVDSMAVPWAVLMEASRAAKMVGE